MALGSPPSLAPDLQALLREAVAAFNSGELASAEARCQQLLGRAPGNARVLGVYGAILHAQERYTDAERVFSELAQAEPGTALHWMNLGTARRGAGKYDEALQAYTRAADLGCATPDFYFNVGLTHLDRRDYESARAVLKKALELAPDDA